MDFGLIKEGNCTIEDILELNKLGYSFIIEDGKITDYEEE